jgi:outer membrane biogenesis lipoprotein LolB
MKKNIIILLSITLLLSGCGEEKEKTQEKNYSNQSFTDISWKRNAENDEETIIFKADGSFTYYCACGNPVNDSDLCETFTYNEDTKEITLDCLEETEDTITTIKVINSTDTTLELDFDGEIRKFEKSNE